MKAILVKNSGGSDQLEIGSTPTPSPEKNEVLIKIKACSLNRADILQREGKYPPPKGASSILGLDCAGVIEKIGSEVKNYKVGDRVMSLLSGGGYAEFTNVHEDLLLPIPENLSFEEATAIPEVFLTAFQTLFWIGNLQAGQNILIHAGASGVGSAAIQLAKATQAHQIMITAGSSEKIEFCHQLGSTFGINYKKQDFLELIKEKTNNKGVDIILDFIGAPYLEKNLKSLDFDGKLILIAGMGGFKTDKFNILPFLLKRVQVFGTTLRARSHDYKVKLTQEFSDRFLKLFSTQELFPVVDKIFPAQEVIQAHDYMENNLNKGKIILKMDNL